MTFNHKKWLTPNTYDSNFAEPKGRGIYLLASRQFDYSKNKMKVRRKILYVGMTENLCQRLKNHAVLNELRKRFEDVVIFFKNHDGELRSLERHFIHHFNPPYNIIGRRRGL